MLETMNVFKVPEEPPDQPPPPESDPQEDPGMQPLRPPPVPPPAKRPPGGGRRWLYFAIASVMVAAAVAVGWQYRQRVAFDNFAVVEPGKIYRSGQLTPAQLEHVIREYGIRTIIKTNIPELSLQDMAREQVVCNRNNVRVVPLIMPGDGRGEYEQYDQALEILVNDANLPALVTCARGVHRTGAIVAVYRVRAQSWPINRALAEMEKHRFDPYRRNRRREDGEHPLLEHLRGYFLERTGYAQ